MTIPRAVRQPGQAPDEAARRAPGGPLQLPRGRASRRLAVLTFHDVDDAAVFRAQLDRLRRTASPVSLGEVEAAVRGGAPLPPHAVLVSFELGHRTAATTALPALAACGVPAVAFVVAGLVDTEQPYWWNEAEYLVEQGGWARGLSSRPQGLPGGPGRAGGVAAALAALPDPDRRRSLQELRVTARRQAPGTPQLTSADLLALRDAGVVLGNHSLGHARLDSCDDYVVREEVQGGHHRLARLTGEEPRAFAYPDGVFDGRAEPLLRGLGYSSAFLTDGALFDLRGASGGRPDPLRISRLQVNTGTPRGLFDGVLSGWNPAARRLRGAVAV
ncbi:polysaccharide deacetylase family protein [Streptacidiphilus sp. PB12-B1b]|uniref:polysaccharide deacetylase family protein n=1 Tax=Streptacidiphilus sp. PB12-B1b TaxID=2705012 RepID=UPI0015F7903A|nr:polysaccharide deacetylase family protein [Streptacidiphilus sp. PB12-B1b]QMU76529.1 polysaccharide deacetylase family protein [Streptacidiphilus sp. PB12-B1b]